MKLYVLLIGFLFSSSLMATGLTKKYYVKGMHCGGCESGVRASLIELGGLKDAEVVKVDSQTPDAKNQIGHVVIKFTDTKYEGNKTDCKLAKAIKKNPGYELYWDLKDTNPCKL
jgi:copper chaperone CopZ